MSVATALDLTDLESKIDGVQFKLLKSHGDDRGFFREIVRESDEQFYKGGFAQWSHSKMVRNTVKAWHYHHLQTDWWYIPVGEVEVVLYDNREEAPTFSAKLIFKLGETAKYGEDVFEALVRIPPGVLHGCRVLSPEAHLFYITSKEYNPEDEGRFPFNDPIAGHDWGSDVIVAENDKRHFTPTAKRTLL